MPIVHRAGRKPNRWECLLQQPVFILERRTDSSSFAYTDEYTGAATYADTLEDSNQDTNAHRPIADVGPTHCDPYTYGNGNVAALGRIRVTG